VLTRGATRFVSELTFSALADEPAQVSLFPPAAAAAVPHIALARRADAVVVAPATARLIGSYAAGISSDLLTATLLATTRPVVLCPAMHAEMWAHPAVQDNVETLRKRGVIFVGPAKGLLAGGDFGTGRMAEPEVVMEALFRLFSPGAGQAGQAEGTGVPRAATREPVGTGPLWGRKAVVSAGGTREALDPVRYMGNRSSGKQGYAVAAELLRRGAEVTLVSSASGSGLHPPPGAAVVTVETAAEMADAVLAASGAADIVVMAAAVADYRPREVSASKLKKTRQPVAVELVPTLDILAELGKRRRPGQVLVGFAAETASGAQLVAAGREKLAEKGADLIVANEVGQLGVGFGEDTTAAVIVSPEGVVDLGVVSKHLLASMLVDAIEAKLRREGAR
jgi:phosphopantothenoylcysteine decarboxylase/phosphopantothenate--cysteine ligase